MYSPRPNEINLSSFQSAVIDRSNHLENYYRFVSHGLLCVIKSTHGFNWTGYVCVPSNHPDVKLPKNMLDKIYKIHNNISINRNVEPSNIHVLGFTTLSNFNYCLSRDLHNTNCILPHRSYDFVKCELEQFANQLATRLQIKLHHNSNRQINSPEINETI